MFLLVTDWTSHLSHSLILTPSLVWGICFFTLSAYTLLVYSSSLYFLPVLMSANTTGNTAINIKSIHHDALTLFGFLSIFCLYQIINVLGWSGVSLHSSFGHLIYTNFERKISLLIFIFFLFYLVTIIGNHSLLTVATYDYFIVINQLTYWLTFLFSVLNILSLSFVIEVLTSLITLLLVTSYNTNTYNTINRLIYQNTTFVTSLPTTYFFSLLTFFWISLLTTLLLFLFILTIYIKLLVLDWLIVDLILNYLITTSSTYEISSISFSWSLILLCIFLKCAITPFYLWKPTFFKGMTHSVLFYYIFVFYFTLFLYFIYFLMGLFSELLLFNSLFLSLIIFGSIIFLPGILYETLNLKSFLALSSIMNSVIILILTLNFNLTSSILFI